MVVEVLFMDSSEHTIDNSSVVFVMDRNEVSFDARSDDGIDLVGGSRITANFVLSMSRTNFIFDASMLQKIGISLAFKIILSSDGDHLLESTSSLLNGTMIRPVSSKPLSLKCCSGGVGDLA